MNRSKLNVLIAAGVSLGLVASAVATENADMTFSKPTNTSDATVQVFFDPGPDVSVPIPAGTSAEGKRNRIRDALRAAGYDVVDGAAANQLTVQFLRNGTGVRFDPGTTGELRDDVVGASVAEGNLGFQGFFEPFDADRQPAIFTGGIITDVGELSVQISAQELNFQTEGPIICQALFQRLAPRAPQYGAQINYAGDRLEVYFDPEYTVTQGGIVFGTTSPSSGCFGEIVLPGEGGDACADNGCGGGPCNFTNLVCKNGGAKLISKGKNSTPGDQVCILDGDGNFVGCATVNNRGKWKHVERNVGPGPKTRTACGTTMTTSC